MAFLVGDNPEPRIAYDLPAAACIRVPPLCLAIIPHRVRIEHEEMFGGAHTQVIWLVGVIGLLESKHLIIQTGPIDIADDVCTVVFNINPRLHVRVEKGEVFSRLLSVQLG